MPPSHISGTCRALYRVFIAPTLRAPTAIPVLWAPAFAHSPSRAPSLTPRTAVRTKTYVKDVARHALTDHYVLDGAIRSNRINFIDENGTFYPGMLLADALFRVDSRTHHLVQLTPGKVDEFGNQDPDDLPTCRVTTKIALREKHARKLDLARRQAKGHGAGLTPKNMEFSWAIAGGDLKHRLSKLKEFLADGRKVEILLAPKKRGRTATEEEANGLMAAIREAVEQVKDAKERKSEGTVGGIMMLTIEGPKQKKKRDSGKNADNEGSSADNKGPSAESMADAA